MAKLPLKTAVKTATRSPLDELLAKPVKLKDRTPEPPKPAGKAAGGRLSEPKAAGNTVIVAADSTQPGSGEIRRMVEAGEPLPTDLKGLVKVSDAIRAGASPTEVKPYILSMGNKRRRQVLADGGTVHRRLKGTGYDGANRKGQFQKGRGKTGKPGTKVESASPGSPQAGGTDYVSKKTSNTGSFEGPSPGSKGTLGERKRAAAPDESVKPAKFTPGAKELPPAFGPKRGVAAPKTEKGGVGAAVGKEVGKRLGDAAVKAGSALFKKTAAEIGSHPLAQSINSASEDEVAEVLKVVKAVKGGRWNSAIARMYSGAIPGGKVLRFLQDYVERELERQ